MPLATKTGSLIVKDGKVAENCGCCGGWYCCQVPECLSNDLNGIEITLAATASQYAYTDVLEYQFAGTVPETRFLSRIIVAPTASVAGTHSLSRLSATQWEKTLPGDARCGLQPKIIAQYVAGSQSASVRIFITNPAYSRTQWLSAPRYLTPSEITCENTGIGIYTNVAGLFSSSTPNYNIPIYCGIPPSGGQAVLAFSNVFYGGFGQATHPGAVALFPIGNAGFAAVTEGSDIVTGMLRVY